MILFLDKIILSGATVRILLHMLAGGMEEHVHRCQSLHRNGDSAKTAFWAESPYAHGSVRQ